LSTDIETEKPAKAQRAAEVANAQQILKQAEDAQQKASDDTSAALSARRDTSAVLFAALSAQKDTRLAVRKAKEVADEAQAEVDLFFDNSRQHFSFLEAQTTKVEEIVATTSSDVAIGGC